MIGFGLVCKQHYSFGIRQRSAFSLRLNRLFPAAIVRVPRKRGPHERRSELILIDRQLHDPILSDREFFF